MQFIDLAAQQKIIRKDIDERIKKVLDHGKYIMGPEVTELEEKLADFVNVKHAISVSNGTDALLMSLMAYDIGEGDLVFTTPFTFIATASVVRLVNATPVFADILPETFNIDPEKLELAIQDAIQKGKGKPRAIIAVDLFGQLADYEKIQKIANKYGLILIEDAAQSFGANFQNKKACSYGDIATTSFFPAKPLGCYGDGGMIFTNCDEIKDKLHSIRVHGQGFDKYNNIRIGINGRMDTLQAAIVLSKMTIFEDEIVKRQIVASHYEELLNDSFKTPKLKAGHISAWAQYCILSDNRERMFAKLQENNIPYAVYYPKPLHLQDAFKDLGYKKGDFPVSEEISEKIFSLPFHPYLEKESQEKIAAVLKG
jgi:UDP-2-acetamido-2-deoxy-ribo-hexuluronate aminotransferase